MEQDKRQDHRNSSDGQKHMRGGMVWKKTVKCAWPKFVRSKQNHREGSTEKRTDYYQNGIQSSLLFSWRLSQLVRTYVI